MWIHRSLIFVGGSGSCVGQFFVIFLRTRIISRITVPSVVISIRWHTYSTNCSSHLLYDWIVWRSDFCYVLLRYYECFLNLYVSSVHCRFIPNEKDLPRFDQEFTIFRVHTVKLNDYESSKSSHRSDRFSLPIHVLWKVLVPVYGGNRRRRKYLRSPFDIFVMNNFIL